MKKAVLIAVALLFALPMFAQKETKKEDKKEDVYVWCVMPNKKGEWLKLTPPTPKVVSDFQEKLIYLKLLNEYDIVEKGKLDRATSDAILKMEARKGVTYESKELVGFTQGMKNRLLVMYAKAIRAEKAKKKQ
ncbi:hypothetical protein U8527_04450 [Kordia algicida OT-1]|uniref:Peptidoglycan binding-like domain-containing protein n=1 Tax=Kordia algicida OT-1 TaxID=391587 RepID=A9DQ03_9FLAO|nr:hypothetical protein [Kordia algicida]EDP97573.1 hypothetical protein KAOT1_20462 [Kordia algicida OT-1]